MKFNNYIFTNLAFFTKLTLFVGIFFLSSQTQTWAQTKVLTSEVTHTSGNDKMTSLLGCGPLGLGACYAPTVQNPNNALEDDNTYARLLASPGLALDFGSYKGVIELKFENTLPADTWSYVRMEGDSDLFRALLGGSLGNLLGDVLGYVLIGNQEVVIDARMGSTSILSRSSTQGFGTDRVKLIQDGNGNNYLAIRPASAYDRLRITNQTGSLLGLGNEKTLDVYNAFHYEDTGNDCGRPFATSFDGGGGIGLEVGDLNDQNLGNAIDNDDNSFSRLKSSSVLNVNVASTLSQYFYFPTTSSATTTANIKLALGSGGLVNTDLLGAIEIIFFEDNTIVSRRSLQSSLLNNTNALTLLDSGDPVTLTFAPGKAFDRIAIKLNSPVGVNLLGNGVKIYDVQRYDGAGCPNPLIAALPSATDDPFETASCANELIDFDNVDFAHRAVDGNNESYATLHADAGNLLVSGPTAGFIEMDLGQTVPANKTTYVRINYDEDVLDALLGGSLGQTIGTLLNGLALGEQYFEIEAKNDESIVLNSSSINAFEGSSNGVVTLVQDNIGRYYIAITPDADYNRIRITNHVVALLSTGKKTSLDVYNACFEIGTDSCFPANFTSYRGGGIGLNAGNISSVGVTNAYRAISENSSDYSEINLGVAGLLAHVYQTVYFSQPSQPNDKVKIQVAIEPSSALSLDVLGRYRIKFFNGATQVGTDETLESGLINNLDLLALFGSGGIVELEYEPNGIFDRVEIGAESIASVNVATEPLRLYSVERYGDTCPLTKTPFPFEEPSCSTTLVASHNADNVQNLFDDDFDSYATLKSGAGILLGLGNKYEGYVEMGYDQPVAAGVTSYIRIDFGDNILPALVGGSLGNVVSGLLDGLVLGDHFFTVDVKDASANIIHSASSNQASAGGDGTIRVVQDAAGRYYIAVTPTSDYQSVRITDATNSLLALLAQPNTMNVYGMCTDMVTDPCFGAFATSYEHSGLSLSVNDLGGAGVTNGSYAINGNTTNYSEISNGTLGVGASTKQWIYFNSVSNENDIATIKFKTEGGVVDADILGGLEIKAYLANEEVYSVSSQNGLINGINVAQLLTNNEMVTLDISPGQSFDRISVGIKTLVDVSVFPPIHLYSVGRICGDDSIVMPDPIYGCNDNAFINSSNPHTIEYDNIVGLFHSTILKESDGSILAWGASAAADGDDQLTPIEITPSNGYTYSGDILKFTGAGAALGAAQFTILTTEGLYFWGTEGLLIHSSLTSGKEFGKGNPIPTIGESGANPYSLPIGVEPTDVKMLFGTAHSLALSTYNGDAWVLTMDPKKYGDGTNTDSVDAKSSWHRVMINADTPLSNVVAIRGSAEVFMALTVTNEIYTWGIKAYLGDGSARSDLTWASLMPTTGTPLDGKTIKMIGTTAGGGIDEETKVFKRGTAYFVLLTNGELYSMGYNKSKVLGTFNYTDYTTWQRVKKSDEPGDFLENIVWISPNEHSKGGTSNLDPTVIDDVGYSAINALCINGKLWSWGANDTGMLGGSFGDGYNQDPTSMPGGLDEDDYLIAVETGGHTTMVIKQCTTQFGYIGHRVRGSMGDGTDEDETEHVFNFTDTAIVDVCGAPAGPIVSDLEFCPTTVGQTINLENAVIRNNIYTLTWYLDADRTSIVPDPTAVGLGVYYLSFENNDLHCADNIMKVEVTLPDDCIAELILEKEGVFNDLNEDGIAQVGETITYTFNVKNTGNSAITNIVVTDPLVTVSGDPIDLDSNQNNSTTFTAVYVITEEDITNKGVYNLAMVTGKDPKNEDVTNTSVDPISLHPDNPMYDPDRPNHTYVPLKVRSLLITNPHIRQRMKR